MLKLHGGLVEAGLLHTPRFSAGRIGNPRARVQRLVAAVATGELRRIWATSMMVGRSAGGPRRAGPQLPFSLQYTGSKQMLCVFVFEEPRRVGLEAGANQKMHCLIHTNIPHTHACTHACRDLSSTRRRRPAPSVRKEICQGIFPWRLGVWPESKTPGGSSADHGIERVTVVHPRCEHLENHKLGVFA